MKNIKLYDVIFPIWLILLFPPFLFLTLIENFIIDSLVVIACFFVFKVAASQSNLKNYYRQSIVKVWLFGYLADIIGTAILFVFGAFGDILGIPEGVITGICFDPFSSPVAVIIIIFAMLIAAAFIFLFNYKFTFKKLIKDNTLRFKIALTIAIVTIPWTLLLPTKWFYH